MKNAAALERFAAVDTLLLDKTGTLTAGKPTLTHIATYAGSSEAEALRNAASLERHSEHPPARAVLEEAHARGSAPAPVADLKVIPGAGLKGSNGQRRLALGNERLMAEEGVAILPEATDLAETWRGEAATVIHLAMDGRLEALLAASDPLKPGAERMVEALRAQGLHLVMLTGDEPGTARAVGSRLGITEIEAGLTPEGKAEAVARHRASGRKTAMVGDGINDAPALAAADVGIAMTTGTEVAVESAGITLAGGDPGGILRARRLARATLANIKKNLAFAFAYNGLGIPIAAGVLYPWTGLLLSPMLAAAAMALSSVSVILNAGRLRSLELSAAGAAGYPPGRKQRNRSARSIPRVAQYGISRKNA